MDWCSPGHFSNALATPVSRRAALRGLGLAGTAAAGLCAIGSRSIAVAQEAAIPTSPPRDWVGADVTFGMHGQVIMGDGPIYLSHLPMFLFDNDFAGRRSHPHHYQVILEVEFSGQGADDYLDDRKETGAPLYTLAPSPFDMLDLVSPALEEARVSSFTGTIVRGHFERPNSIQPFDIVWEELPNQVQVDVTGVVYAHEYSFHPAALEQLEYVLFGAGADLFLAHRIVTPPDFDQLLPARIEGATMSDEALQRGIIVTIPDRGNAITDRLMAGDTVEGEARDAETGILLATGVQIAADQELHLEEGEMHFPGVFDSTNAEIEAGFGYPEKSA